MSILSKIKQYKLSQVLFWTLLISLPFNKRVIYQPELAYIDGYFSYYNAVFLYASDILLVLCFTAYVIENLAYIRQNSAIWKTKWFWISLGLLISFYIGWFHVQHAGFWPIYSLLKVLELILLVWLTSNIMIEPLSLKVSLWILYISGVFQAFLGIWQFHVQHGVGLGLLGEYVSDLGTGGLATIDTSAGKIIRAYGTFPHPNALACFLLISLILGLYFVSRETRINRIVFLVMANIALIFGIFVTFSRATWLTAALVILINVWRLFTQNNKKGVFFLIISGFVSCATILIYWHKLLFTRISNITSSNSYIDRGTYNHVGLEIAKTHFLGTGIGNYVNVMKQMFHMQPWEYQPSHNIFIYILASGGVTGVILFVYFLWNIFRSTWNAKPSDMRFTFLVIGFSLLFLSLFDHFLVTIQQGQLLFFTILGMMLAYAKQN